MIAPEEDLVSSEEKRRILDVFKLAEVQAESRRRRRRNVQSRVFPSRGFKKFHVEQESFSCVTILPSGRQIPAEIQTWKHERRTIETEMDPHSSVLFMLHGMRSHDPSPKSSLFTKVLIDSA